MSNDKRILLKMTNLKQHFPLKEKGKFVKANDGISVDIYEGETFGLVGESGCGKSTFGRTILQFYLQTDGRTMYYGKKLGELAPAYVKSTLKNLSKLKNKYKELEAKREKLQKEYDSGNNEENYELRQLLDTAKKQAYDTFLDISNIIGGLLLSENEEQVAKIFLKEYDVSVNLRNAIEKMRELNLDLAEAKFELSQSKDSALASANGKLEKSKQAVKKQEQALTSIHENLSRVRSEIDGMKAAFSDNEEFARIETFKSDAVDLARLKYNEMRILRNELQLIFQDPYSSLNPRMSVGQIVGEGMIAHKQFRKNDARMQEEVLRVMDSCGLAPYFIHRFPHQFSGGQRQRIGIARSLAVKPKFVVCDEAVSALDVSIQSQVINLLQDLKEEQNLTYLFITHDLSVVKYISSRIGVMYLGNIVELADSQEIFSSPLHPYTKALLDAIPTTDIADSHKKLSVIEGDIPSPVNPPKGCKFHTRCSLCTDICRQVVPEWVEVKPKHFVACHHNLMLDEKSEA